MIRALRDLHPTRTTELHPPTPSAPQLVIIDDTIFKLLYQQAEAEHVKRDAFGWSAPLLLPCRAAYGGALVALSKMLALIASDPELFPPPCPQLLSTGCLTPINKLCAVERKLMEEIGASPKVRPINAGTEDPTLLRSEHPGGKGSCSAHLSLPAIASIKERNGAFGPHCQISPRGGLADRKE